MLVHVCTRFSEKREQFINLDLLYSPSIRALAVNGDLIRLKLSNDIIHLQRVCVCIMCVCVCTYAYVHASVHIGMCIKTCVCVCVCACE